ncbi:MAG TPA: ribonuclease R [Cyclobacteriaceae bacterium]
MGRKKKKDHSNKKIKKVRRSDIANDIQQLLNSNLSSALSIKQITKKLGYRDKIQKNMVPETLFDLERSGSVQRLRNGSFKSTREAKLLTGVVDHVNPKFAYIISEESEDDIWVRTDDLNFAINGDTVSVQVYPQKHGKKPEGKVKQIIQRGKDEWVGRVEISKNYAFVIPDNKRIYCDVFIASEDINKARSRDKVIVKILNWPSAEKKNPKGEIIRVLGPAGENEAEIHSIMAQFELPFEFPDKVLAESERIPEKISRDEISSRRDFRNILTFTIDPEDAKDFDDAISLQTLENGNTEIGVHIADVTHFLREDTVLDKEAFDRATSVYLVDRTIPMLPERLSNGVCSLNPNEDKLTFSAVFEMDDKATVKRQWFGKTIIHSDKRFAYEQAQEIIESGSGEFSDELVKLNELARKLRKDRFANGAINFETIEVKFRLDEKGKPLEVYPKERKDAHKLIEEFMLLANKKVAEFIFKKKSGGNKSSTFVYRTHDSPDPDKIKAFSIFARKFGYQMKLEESSISRSLNSLIDAIEGKPEQNVLESLAIRTMAKAKYTTEPDPHFGLAFMHYTHFTSPIRRYPDVMVHRLLFLYLQNGKSPDEEEYEDKCEHSSEREKRAAEAERASIKYKQVEFMQTRLGEEFDGIVSGVTEWGVFVEMIETKCEGMIRISEIRDDFYEFDEENFRIVGVRNKRIITLGDDIKVKVVKTDIDRRTIDLEMIN